MPLDWREPEFYDADALEKELERVFDICHGCRRCFSLCNAFPTLFDAVDASATGELDGVDRKAYWAGRRSLLPLRHVLHDQVSVRAAASVERRFPAPDAARQGGQALAGTAERGAIAILSSTDAVGRFAGIPVVAEIVNAVNRSSTGRKLLEQDPRRARARAGAGVSQPVLPGAATASARPAELEARAAAETTRQGRAVRDLLRQSQRARPRRRTWWRCSSTTASRSTLAPQRVVLRHAEARARRPAGDREAQGGEHSGAGRLVDRQGYDIVAPIPSCVLMFKQELPLMFPDDAAGRKRERAHVRSVRIPDAAAQGRACCAPISRSGSARSPITCPVTCACRTSD